MPKDIDKIIKRENEHARLINRAVRQVKKQNGTNAKRTAKALRKSQEDVKKAVKLVPTHKA